MAELLPSEIQLLTSLKAMLIDILSADPDFVLQHADSRGLLSRQGYQQVRSVSIPTEKVRDLLDHVIFREQEGLLDLLKDEALQETFPRLHFLKNLTPNTHLAAGKNKTRKRNVPMSEETIPPKQTQNHSSNLVTEKQLMRLAGAIGHSWKEIGIQTLNIPSVKLEHIEEENPRCQVYRVFTMLRLWRTRQRELATAERLHSLLGEALPPDAIDILLETE